MFAKKIQVAALSLALLVPAESALAEHHSQTRGAVIGGIAGALIGRGGRSAAVGAAVARACRRCGITRRTRRDTTPRNTTASTTESM